jgi:hypothetical protein
MSDDQVALLIIRTWIEGDSGKPLRAHVRLTSDVAAHFEREVTLADIESVGAVVREWLESIQGGDRAT